jgi:hypothetical protein
MGPAADILRPSWASRSFPLALGVLLGLVAAWGFGPTLDERFFRPPSPRPPILYVHAALMAAWVALLIAQASLVYARRVAWHRRLGGFGLVLGAAIPVVGAETTLAMARLHRAEGVDQAAFIVVSLFDMAAFAVVFGLAAAWRRRPAVHGRLMLMASCGLAVPAFARLPGWLMPDNAWYLCVDALILAAALRDRIVMGRVHPVYRYGLPILAAGQAAAMWIYLSAAPAWVAIANVLLNRPPAS